MVVAKLGIGFAPQEPIDYQGIQDIKWAGTPIYCSPTRAPSFSRGCGAVAQPS